MKATLVDMEKPWLDATLHCKWATSYAEAIYTLKYQGLSRTGLLSNQPPDFQYLSTGFVRYLPTHTYLYASPPSVSAPACRAQEAEEGVVVS